MGKKNIVLLLLVVCLFSFISATDSLGTFQQNADVSLFQSCDTCTYVTLDSIKFPNGTIININTNMTKDANSYNYTFSSTALIGEYSYTVCGDKDSSFDCETIPYTITYTGDKINTSQSIVLLAQLGLVAFFFALGRIFDKSKWKIVSLFNILSILMALILVNSIRIVASQSSNLNEMGKLGFLIVSVLLGFMLLYVFVYYTIEMIQYFKTKKGKKWNIQ